MSVKIFFGEATRPQKQKVNRLPEALIDVRRQMPGILQQRADATCTLVCVLAALGAIRAGQSRAAVAAAHPSVPTFVVQIDFSFAWWRALRKQYIYSLLGIAGPMLSE